MKTVYYALAAMVLTSFIPFAKAEARSVSKPVISNETVVSTNSHQPCVRVAEPATLILLGSGLFALGTAKRLMKGKD